MMKIRTDLAVERLEAAGAGHCGMTQERDTVRGIPRIRVTGENGERYLTLCAEGILRQEREGFSQVCHAIADQLKELLPVLEPDAPVLMIGLGNRAVTPDAIGPLCCQSVFATRHLIGTEPLLDGFRPVSVLSPGVLGTTGVESGEIVRGLMERIAPAAVIAVDALAARRMSRLMSTIQLTDAGIVPGSGVGNSRTALDRQTLGIPVAAIGVPTVIDTASVAQEIEEELSAGCEALDDLKTPAIVTTRDVDRQIAMAAKVIGCGIDLFLHPMLSIEDIEAML